ncbi:MAG TPA: hypothetical protein VG838_08560 [Opitutaceae bacterium]|nr:hypothetical protein [Opitutaceae bacterium]
MSTTFETVDEKIAEAEFFLGQMCGADAFGKEFKWYFSAFLAATRTSTLALQRFGHLPGFAAWYVPHRLKLVASTLAKNFHEMRNDHVHGGEYPVGGSGSGGGQAVKHFFPRKSSKEDHPLNDQDIVSASRDYFLLLLEIVYDCYVVLGVRIDPQQYYTRQHYPGGDIDVAETEVHGWVCMTLVKEGLNKAGRWHELRSHVGECTINHLFYSYLGKVTPQPKMPPEHYEIEPSPEDRSWIHVPAGFASLKAYQAFRKAAKTAGRKNKQKA